MLLEMFNLFIRLEVITNAGNEPVRNVESARGIGEIIEIRLKLID